MSLARTWAVALTGIEGTLVEVEADLSHQTPDFRIIGLPDRALGEAVQRVHNACANSELALPRRRLTVNLSPASLPKHGAGFDLAIAVAALATEVPLNPASVAETAHLGELGLDGRLRPVPGVLPAVVAAAARGLRRVVVPVANLAEARLVAGVQVIGAAHLRDVMHGHGAEVSPWVASDSDAAPGARAADASAPPPPELADVVGQPEAVEALVVAAAGGHHMLLSGPPGAGKTMLARRLPGILPPLDDAAALRVACVRSVTGRAITRLERTPPFEAPHHGASAAALIGGGSGVIRPGAIARATEGVLFLDEAGEFAPHVLDALRQPLESGAIHIQRAGAFTVFPARFQLVMATNPCPCGNYGVRGAECSCAPQAIRRYLGRLSGPLVDRIDIDLPLRRVSVAHADATTSVSTEHARARVVDARARAHARLADTPWRCNREVPGTWLRRGPYAPEHATRRPLDDALQRGLLTLRGYDRVLRLAWTLADLTAAPRVGLDEIGRALFLNKGIAA